MMTQDEFHAHSMSALRQLTEALRMPVVILAFPAPDSGFPGPVAATANITPEDTSLAIIFAAESFAAGDFSVVAEQRLTRQ